MSLTLTNVGVSDATRYQSSESGHVITANVRLNFNEDGHDHQLGLGVDLKEADGLTLAEIETAAIREAARVIQLAATLDAAAMDALFRSQFSRNEPAT